MRRSLSRKRALIIAVTIVAGTIACFAYFGIDAARNMDVSMYDSEVVSKNEQQTIYDATIQFKNTSFVPISVGNTNYNITVEGEYLGSGTIEPFMIGPYSTMLVSSEFVANNSTLDRYNGEIPHELTEIRGTSNYDLYLTTFEVPINHQPTPDQIQKFTK